MADNFDPYIKWLGIRDPERPPNHYRLLGLELFEADVEVIEAAADRQMGHVRTYQSGPQSEVSQRVLNELAAARIGLLSKDKKAAYDAQLRAKFAAQQAAAGGTPASLTSAANSPSTAKELRTRATALPVGQPLPVAQVPSTAQPVAPSSSLPDDFAPPPPPSVTAAKRKTQARKSASRNPVVIGGLAVGGVLLVGAIAFVLMRRGDPPQPDSLLAKDQSKPANVRNSPPSTTAKKSGATTRPTSQSPDKTKEPIPESPTGRGQPQQPTSDLAPRSKPPEVATVGPVGEPEANDAAEMPEQPDPGESNGDDDRQEVAMTRQPVPDAASQRSALKSIQDIFKSEYAKAKTATAQSELGKKLLDQAREEQKEVERFVLLAEARRLANDAGDVDSAFSAIDEAAETYELAPLPAKAEVLTSVSKRAKLPSQFKGLAECASEQIDAALAAEDPETAAQLLDVFTTCARKAKDGELLKQIATRTKQVQDFVKLIEPIDAARKILADKPGDPDANSTIGRYLCLVQGDWAAGVPMLARGSDKILAHAAAMDAESPSDAAGQVKVGNTWWSLAEGDSGATKDRLRQRAGYWYTEALPSLPAGNERVRLEKRLGEIDKEKVSVTSSYGFTVDSIVLVNQNNGARGDRGTQQCNVVLLLGDREVWRQNGVTMPFSRDQDAEFAVRPPKQRFDRLRVEVSRWYEKGGGLAEVEIWQGRTNLATDSLVTASAELNGNEFRAENVVDKIRTSREYSRGYWILPDGEAGWVEMDLRPTAIAKSRLPGSSASADAILIWNTHDGPSGDYGAKKCNVTLTLQGKVVWTETNLEVPWSAANDRYLFLRPPARQFDRVRVEVSDWYKRGGGLSEIEVIQGGNNLAKNSRATASAEFSNDFKADLVKDGIRTSRGYIVGYWLLPENTAGWVELQLPKQIRNDIASKATQDAHGKLTKNGPESLVIVKADFGTDTRWVDCTKELIALVKNGRLVATTNVSLVANDPAPGVPKATRIKYQIGTKVETKEFPQGQILIESPIQSAPSGTTKGLDIVDARVGTGATWKDVTPRMRKLVQRDKLQLQVNTPVLAGKDLAPGADKFLFLAWLEDGKPRTAFFSENIQVNIGPGSR